jgi:hypothetical protein
MIPASPVSPSAVVPHEDREVLEETQLCVGAALDLEGLGKSFFCNVLHLNDHGITRPLTFITVNILRRNHLIRVRASWISCVVRFPNLRVNRCVGH